MELEGEGFVICFRNIWRFFFLLYFLPNLILAGFRAPSGSPLLYNATQKFFQWENIILRNA